jgi:RNA polymerase sigma factor (sigma-70 family)
LCGSQLAIMPFSGGLSQTRVFMTADLAQLFELYYASLVRMLYRRTGDRDRAEDLAQETFARAVAAPPNNPRPWLFAVALNLVREDGRRAATRGRRLELLRAEHDQPADGPDVDLDRREAADKVRAALAKLNERDREALLLKAEGFDYEEIAATLGLAKGAIGTTLARARRRLVEAYRAQERAQTKERGKNVAS